MTPKREMGVNSPEIVISGQKVLIPPEMEEFTENQYFSPKRVSGWIHLKYIWNSLCQGDILSSGRKCALFLIFREFHQIYAISANFSEFSIFSEIRWISSISAPKAITLSWSAGFWGSAGAWFLLHLNNSGILNNYEKVRFQWNYWF